MATEETQNDNAERDSLTEEPVMVNFDPSNDDQPEQVPPPIPNDTNPNQTESKQDTENEENDESLEVDYDNPISIPLAVPTDSVRSLMFDTYSIPQKPGPNISAMVNASNNYNQSLPPPQPQPDKDENETENDDNTSNLPPPAPSNDEPDPPPSIPPPYQNEDEQDEDEEDPYIPEENELPHNATTHNAIFDLDFDTNINAIIINIKDEVTGKSWKMELTEEESTNGQSIREEYAKLGQTLSTGKCQYIYPPNNSRDPITVTVSNDDNEYTYTVPDSRAPKKPKKKNDIDPEGTPESEQQDNDDNDVIVDTLVPTKKTPGIDDNTSPGPTPPPPQPPNTFGINIENIDVKEDSDSEPPPPPQHNQDSSLYFDAAPDKVHITPGSIPKQSMDEPEYKDEIIMMDGVVTGGGPDDYYDDEKRSVLPNYEDDQKSPVMLEEGLPVPMSGKPLEEPDKPYKKATMEMGMPSHKSTMVMDDEYNPTGRATVLDTNNRAAKTIVASQEEERRREEERLNRQKSDLSPTSWYTDFLYEPESRPWWLPIDPYDKNDQTANDVKRPSMDLTTFDDQLPKNAVTSQRNLIKRQLYHAQQQQRISRMNLDAEKINAEVPEESVDDDNNDEYHENEPDDVYQDPLKRKNLNIAGLGVIQQDSASKANDKNIEEANAMEKVISASGKEISEDLVMMNQLLIDFNVIIRKFILFTSVLFMLTFCMLLSGAITGFYQWKGYVVNSMGIVLFGLGIFIGFRSEKHWSFTQRLQFISYYWFLSWIVLIIVFTLSLIYVFVLPSKYTAFCEINDCSASGGGSFMLIIAAALTWLVWLLIALFYIDLTARTIIVCGRFYDLWSKQVGLLGLIHKQCYRFRSTFNNFRMCLGRNTGIRMDDFIHCSCCCRYCKRKNEIIINDRRTSDINMYIDWEPFENDGALEFRKDHKCCRGLKLNCCGSKSGNDGGYYRRSSYDYTGGERFDLTRICGICCACFKCFGCCKDLGGCLEQCTEGIGLLLSSCIARFKVSTFCGCICDKKDDYSRRNQRKYDCHECGCGKLNCHCYWLCGGEAVFYVYLCIIIACILLLPLILFAIIATPFWLLGQLISSKLNSQRKFFVVVIVFIIILIPPFVIWFLLFAQICDGYDDGKGGSTQIMCFLWSVVNTIYE